MSKTKIISAISSTALDEKLGILDLTISLYSQVPIKRVGPNQRVGWF